jgi:dinuclear metal center YbgI/SA1388 family protein
MTSLSSVTTYLNKYLRPNEIIDEAWNGLQYQGKSEINRIAFAVDASLEAIRRAKQTKAQLLIVHHGLFWQSHNPSITSIQKEKIQIAVKSDISVYASHLPLDRHPEVGNNAQIMKMLGAKIDREFIFRHSQNIGWIGKWKKPRPLRELAAEIQSTFGGSSHLLAHGTPSVQTIAVCSGSGGYGGFNEALKENVDLYLTGDSCYIEPTARDAKINVIFAGHYATETVGLKALAKKLENNFKVTTHFLDIPSQW